MQADQERNLVGMDRAEKCGPVSSTVGSLARTQGAKPFGP